MEFVNKRIPEWTDLDVVLSVLCTDGSLPCSEYPLLGIRLLGDRDVRFEEFLDELRQMHVGYWDVGTRSLGIRGFSQDVDFHGAFPQKYKRCCGEPYLPPGEDGASVYLKEPLAALPDGSGASFMPPERVG